MEARVFTHFYDGEGRGWARQYSPMEKARPITVTSSRNRCSAHGRRSSKDYQSKALITFGFGDGAAAQPKTCLSSSGGSLTGYLVSRRQKIEVCGRLYRQHRSEFDEKLQKAARTPRWVGELYLEFHRGTPAIVQRTKRTTEKARLLLQKAKHCAWQDSLLAGGATRKQTLYDAWKRFCSTSSTTSSPARRFSRFTRTPTEIIKRFSRPAQRVADSALAHIAGQVNTTGGLLVYNPAGVQDRWLCDTENRKAYVSEIPAIGYAVVVPETSKNNITVDGRTIEKQVLPDRHGRKLQHRFSVW